MDANYALALRLNAFAFLFLFIYFVASRYHLARVERALEARREEAALTGGPIHV